MVYLNSAVEILGVAYDGPDLVAEASRLRPEVNIVEVAMPVLYGLGRSAKSKALFPRARFIFLTMRDDSDIAANGTRTRINSELLQSLDHLMHGQSYLKPKQSR